MFYAPILISNLVRALAALLLLLAAEGKAFSAHATSFALAWAALEIGLAAWLLSGYQAAKSRAIATLLFSLFAGLNLAQLHQGQRGCGCFGDVQVPLPVVLAVDGCVLVGLVLAAEPLACSAVVTCRDRLSKEPGRPARSWALWGLALIGFAGGLAAETLDTRFGLRAFLAGRPQVVLSPQQWIGQPVPWSSLLSVPSVQLGHDYDMLMYRSGCSSCRAALRAIPPTSRRGILVVIPSDREPAPRPKQANWKVVELSREVDWLASTPVLISVRDGVVSRVSTNPSGI